jgi:poly-beta-hydroxyalkanoate depolymerase
VLLGPEGGQGSHYGHHDILMGLRVEHEVFPRLHQFLSKHDALCSKL